MTIALLPGASEGIPYPPLPLFNAAATPALAGPTLDQLTDHATFVGEHKSKHRADKTVSSVLLNIGAVVDGGDAGNSTLTVRIEEVDETAGPPFRGNGTLINGMTGSVAINTLSANATNAIPITSGTLPKDKLCAVVVTISGAGVGAGDSVVVRAVSTNDAAGYAGVANNATGSIVNATRFNNVVFLYNDGDFGRLSNSIISSAFTTISLASDATVEAGLRFVAPQSFRADAARAFGSHGAATNNILFALYGSDPAPTFAEHLAVTATKYGRQTGVAATASAWLPASFITPYTLVPGNSYVLAMRSLTAGALSQIFFSTVAAAAHRQCYPFGTDAEFVSRTGSGAAWTAVTTRVPMIQMVGFFDSGLGDGGGVGSIHRSRIGG